MAEVQLDEINGPIMEEGRDVNVIAQQIPVKVGTGSTVFQVVLWCLGIIPGLVFMFMKIKAGTHFRQLQQKIQANASTIDNLIVQRGEIMMNVASLVNKSMELDKETFTKIAALRSGANPETGINEHQAQVDNALANIRVAMENYPELQSHKEIRDALQQNAYLQKEVTAARELYNDSINQWNSDIQIWPTKMIVAAKAGYKTKIPFAASREEKARGKGNFFA